ncbi:hypothetical protein SCUCBS95973_008757 [Sporothrix curviconia]|uniref:Uncharacterized protein n=1 Tax=Sporothrix curviconia TaxID=1260050 RepID=A0ABP0CSE4_9PEZI
MDSTSTFGIDQATGVTHALSAHGSDWLWAVTAVYLVVFLVLLGLCFATPEADRVFHYLFTCMLLAGSTIYFAQAADLGWTAVDDRQLFWAKYANWAVSFPAAAIALGLLADVSWTTIFTNVFSCLLWVVSYLCGSFVVSSSYRWGLFAFGTLAYTILAMSTLNESREAAQRQGQGMARDYMVLASVANAAWLLYPVAWGLGDGSGTIGVTAAWVFVGVLDVVQTPVLAVAFVVLSRRWDYARLNLNLSESRSGWHAGEASGIHGSSHDDINGNGDNGKDFARPDALPLQETAA